MTLMETAQLLGNFGRRRRGARLGRRGRTAMMFTATAGPLALPNWIRQVARPPATPENPLPADVHSALAS